MLTIFKFNFEKWKFNNRYDVWVSTFGRIMNKKGEIRSTESRTTKYCRISVTDNFSKKKSHRRTLLVHRLVLETWEPEGAEGMTVDHLNHNRKDNRISNLEWVPKQVNISRAQRDNVKKKEIDNLEDIFEASNFLFKEEPSERLSFAGKKKKQNYNEEEIYYYK